MNFISLGVAIGALIAACGTAFWAGRLDGRVNNGLSARMDQLHVDVIRLFEKLESLPCERNNERLKHLEEAS